MITVLLSGFRWRTGNKSSKSSVCSYTKKTETSTSPAQYLINQLRIVSLSFWNLGIVLSPSLGVLALFMLISKCLDLVLSLSCSRETTWRSREYGRRRVCFMSTEVVDRYRAVDVARGFFLSMIRDLKTFYKTYIN